FYRKMKIYEQLRYFAALKDVPQKIADERMDFWLERMNLKEWKNKKANDLSKGMQQKIQFISTVLHEPDLLILDEPFSGLDPINAQVMKDTVLDLRSRGKTILFSTHIMEQAEKLCEQLCIIARGRKLVDGALSDIKRTRSGHHLVIGFDGSLGGAAQVFADKELVSKVDNCGQYAELELASGADPQQILRRLVTSGARLSKFELQEASLHKIFIDLVGPDAARTEARPDA